MARAIDEVVREALGLLLRQRLGFRDMAEESALELLDARAGRRRDGVDRDDPLVLDTKLRRLGQQVDLVQHDHLRELVEPRAVRGQLAVDRGPPLSRLAVGGVDHVHEHPRPLQVREELVTEPRALARALDQARDVGDRQLPPVRRVDGAEHRGRSS